MFLFQLIRVLLISITFYTYLANIVFSCDLDFNPESQDGDIDSGIAMITSGVRQTIGAVLVFYNSDFVLCN